VAGAGDTFLAEKQLRRRQILASQFHGFDDALRDHVAVVLGQASPLPEVAQRGHRVRVRRADADVLRSDPALPDDLLVHPPTELLRDGADIQRDDGKRNACRYLPARRREIIPAHKLLPETASAATPPFKNEQGSGNSDNLRRTT